MAHFTQLMLTLAAQNAAGGSLPWIDDLARAGPYGVIAVLLVVCRHLFMRRETQDSYCAAEIKDITRTHAKEKQDLNDKILTLSQTAIGAVTQNTEVQRQLIEVIKAEESR